MTARPDDDNAPLAARKHPTGPAGSHHVTSTTRDNDQWTTDPGSLRVLTNEAWGVTSHCFVCEPTNGAGLRIPFFHDEAADTVTAGFELGPQFSGAPTYVHGGVLLALLDEAMAWAAIAIGGQWAVTGETTTRFEQPVMVGELYRVTARIEDREGASKLTTAAEITDRAGTGRARATATMIVLGEAQAATAAGVTIDELHTNGDTPLIGD